MAAKYPEDYEADDELFDSEACIDPVPQARAGRKKSPDEAILDGEATAMLGRKDLKACRHVKPDTISTQTSPDGKIKYYCIKGENLNESPAAFELMSELTGKDIQFCQSGTSSKIRTIEWWDYTGEPQTDIQFVTSSPKKQISPRSTNRFSHASSHSRSHSRTNRSRSRSQQSYVLPEVDYFADDHDVLDELKLY